MEPISSSTAAGIITVYTTIPRELDGLATLCIHSRASQAFSSTSIGIAILTSRISQLRTDGSMNILEVLFPFYILVKFDCLALTCIEELPGGGCYAPDEGDGEEHCWVVHVRPPQHHGQVEEGLE